MNRLRLAWPAATLVAGIFLTPPHATAQIRFEDASAAAGLSFHLNNSSSGNFHLIELMPGGVAALDYDNDGCTDLYFTNGAAIPSLEKSGPEYWNRLYRNNCRGGFDDVTAKAGVAGAGYSIGVAAADFDNDGYIDLFVAGLNRNILFRNRGDGTFMDITSSARLQGLDRTATALRGGKPWSVAAVWFDADNDGRLDLFVSNYVAWDPRAEPDCSSGGVRGYCPPNRYDSLPNQLFRNNGDGTFTDISASSGIAAHRGRGMGAAAADYNRDGRTDVFVANDSMRNFLFRNDGSNHFTEVALDVGAALGESGRPIASMGVDFRDYDNDGLPDLMMTGMVNDTFLLLRNLGPPRFFEDVTARSGLASATRSRTGWGMALVDLDNDGWRDIFFANAHFPQLGKLLGTASPLPCQIFRNLANARFADVSATAGPDLQKSAFHRGAAFADFNSDGLIDVAVSVLDAPARLFLNRTPAAGHWLAVRLRGTSTNRDGLGAVVRLTPADGPVQTTQITQSVGYASSSEAVARFAWPLGSKSPSVEIEWPSGRRQKFVPEGLDRQITITEPHP